MSREYVEKRLAEIGATPKPKPKKTAEPRRRPVWVFPGVRYNAHGAPVLVCDCHPDLQATANNYIARARSQAFPNDIATWFDVRNAFMIGYHLALEYHRGKNT